MRSRSQSDMLTPARAAASRIKASCSGRSRMRMDEEWARSSSLRGLAMVEIVAPGGIHVKLRKPEKTLDMYPPGAYNNSRVETRYGRRHPQPHHPGLPHL